MRLPIILIVIFITNYVCADGIAKGYERIWMYYAYVLDVEASKYNGGIRTIFPQLEPNARFIDVMQEMSTESLEFRGLLPDDEVRNPPVDETARILLDRGMTGVFDAEYVIEGTRSKMLLVTKVAHEIHMAKVFLPPAARESMRFVSEQIDKSLLMARIARGVEISNFMWKEMGWLPGVKISTVPTALGELISWPDTVMDKDNAGIPDIQERTDEFIREYYANDLSAENHRAVLANMNNAYDYQRQISCGSSS